MLVEIYSPEFKQAHPEGRLVHEKAFRTMTMRNCHSKQQCLEFYAREGIRFIRYMGEEDGYHKFREYYESAFKGL